MRKVIYKWFWVWDFEKEEKWLNEMAAKGLALAAIGFTKYTFEECLPGEYNICFELFENRPSHPESESYISFLEETGAEYLGSMMSWGYFRKKTNSGDFHLYSDNTSRIKYLNRLLRLLRNIALAEFLIGFSNISIYMTTHHQSFNLWAGILCVCLGFLLAYGYFRINKKQIKLKKEQQLFE